MKNKFNGNFEVIRENKSNITRILADCAEKDGYGR